MAGVITRQSTKALFLFIQGVKMDIPNIPFRDLSPEQQSYINDNIDEFIPLEPTSLGNRRSIERDVIGSMLINNTIYPYNKIVLTLDDFKYKRLRGLYKHLISISNVDGSFDSKDVLTNNHDNNKYILNIMVGCVAANINLKVRMLAI